MGLEQHYLCGRPRVNRPRQKSEGDASTTQVPFLPDERGKVFQADVGTKTDAFPN